MNYSYENGSLEYGKEMRRMFARNENIEPLASKVWLSSRTMHGEEMKYMAQAYETNWMSTIGANIDAV